MKSRKIALISPNKSAYSETFIQQHRLHLKGDVTYYFNGYIPRNNDKVGKLLTPVKHIIYKLLGKINSNKFNADEIALIKSFKRNKIDIVVAEYGITATSLLKICKSLKIPLLPIFHGYDASRKDLLSKYKDDYKNVFSYCDKVVTVSKYLADNLINLGCPKEKIMITPCGPDNSFKDIEPTFKSSQFLALGRLVDKKAPYYSILSFKKILDDFPDATLKIGGTGPLENTCQNLISFLGLEDNIEMLGVISRDQFQKEIKNSIAFVQHSIIAKNGDSEGTPVSVLEASLAGLPIISTKHSGIKDVVVNNTTGYLVEEHDVDAMSNAMREILKDLSIAKKLGDNGKKFIQENFSSHIHISKLNETIDSLLNDK